MIAAGSTKANVTLSAYRNESLPKIDSLNYLGGRLECRFSISEHLAINNSAFGDYFDSKDYRVQMQSGISFKTKRKLSGDISMGLGRISGLYGIGNKYVYTGRILLVYSI